MATASNDMVAQLAGHGKAARGKVATLVAHAKAHKNSPNAKKIADAAMALRTVMVQVDLFEENANEKPIAELPDEDQYKKVRSALTKVISVIVKLESAVGKEAVEAEDDDADNTEVEQTEEPTGPIEIECYSSARNELIGNDRKLAQALRMVATGVKGRTGPKEKDIPKYNHIHIGGNARDNLLFQDQPRVVLGVIGFHLDKRNSSSQKETIKKVAKRSGGKTTLKVDGNNIST